MGWQDGKCYHFLSYQIPADDNHQHVILRRKSVIGGTDVTIILCLHVLITHRILINFWIC
jgi:hypothetical protein